MVDSGASIHMLSNRDSSSCELDTLRKRRNITTMITANEEVRSSEEAQVFVHDLDLSGRSVIWQTLPMSGPVIRRIQCKSEYFISVVVPVSSPSSSASSSSTSFPQDSSSTSPSPASLQGDETCYQALGDRRDDPTIKKKRTTNVQRKTACETSPSGQSSSQIISKIPKCQQSQTPLMTQIRYESGIQEAQYLLLTSQKTEIAKSA